MTISVRIPRTSLDLLERVVAGEAQYLQQRRLPTRGVTKSAAFRTIWELGELEYYLQRATLWLTRKNNRYTIDQAAELLGWKAEILAHLLDQRGLTVPAPQDGGERSAGPAPGSTQGPKFLE